MTVTAASRDAEHADTDDHKPSKDPWKGWGRFWTIVGVLTIGLSLAGLWVGYGILGAAEQNQTCSTTARSASWNGIAISGLSSGLQSSFGYGRGTRVIESTLTATARSGVTLPRSIAVYAKPLVTSDGTQVIPSLSSTANRRAQAGISAVATRLASSSTYRLQVCIKAPHAGPGSYSSELLFPGAKLTAGTSLPITVTFQSRIVPFVLTVGLAPLVLLGMLYCTLILIRRNRPDIKPGDIPEELKIALYSVNGIAALILSIGAVFTAWNVQCYRDPIWGTPWPAILVALVTMAGAAAGASTVPMGLAKDEK
jgi:hypothetical protein